ncbi:CBS domain-containing protein [Lutibacter sp. HS1-25]|uniref:CBS domain-containing protein n=1 Tax=Lutibacter sp. HS1-25 TaxID=2485000 RepID=UPI0010117318|nr:CBS domain-containing protein [Lutibacter sp. HS1-25]RXP45900.1 CBS domain-containing protein [Lutibacter sp. HS1-25]
METTPYILKEYSPFLLETTIEEIKLFFHETSFSHFPVVENKKLIGIISKTTIEEIEQDDKEIGYLQYALSYFNVEENVNILTLLTIFSANNTNIVPVTDLEQNYIGYFELTDILHLITETPFLKTEGIALSIEKEIDKFSFSEVCQIVESNKGKIYGLFISESTPAIVKITLKFSAQNVNEILQSFRRYNYLITSKHKEDFYLEDLQERSNYLQKYLNI